MQSLELHLRNTKSVKDLLHQILSGHILLCEGLSDDILILVPLFLLVVLSASLGVLCSTWGSLCLVGFSNKLEQSNKVSWVQSIFIAFNLMKIFVRQLLHKLRLRDLWSG